MVYIEENSEKPYQPHLNRSHPFKWINFPVFLGIWFTLFWFITCPIVWTKLLNWTKYNENSWPEIWPYYFWIAAFLIFIVILTILLAIWKCTIKKRGGFYNTILLNSQFGDEAEKLCSECTNFHPPGKNCSSSYSKTPKCNKCGNPKESFDNCCRNIQENRSPPYDVVLQKPQPKDDIQLRNKVDELDCKENKRNSLKSIKLRNSSTSSTVLISSHDIGTKNLISKPQRKDLSNYHTETETDYGARNKKNPNLKPVNVDLANKYNENQTLYYLEKHDNAVTTPTSESNNENSPESSFSTNKKYNEFLHLVEITTPFTPEENIGETIKTPLSPREIFFYDLIQAVEQSENASSPDSLHFGGYKKKRPTSHILIGSEVNYDAEVDKEKLEESSTSATKCDNKLHIDPHHKVISSENLRLSDCPPEVPRKTVTLKIVRTISKNSDDNNEQ